MAIEQTIHARLSGDSTLSALVHGQVFPTSPSINPDHLPYLVFTIQGSETQNYTSGPSNLTRYTFAVDSWAVNASDLWAVMDRTKVVLHGWRNAPVVQHCFMSGSSTDRQENGYHGQQTFVVWATA